LTGWIGVHIVAAALLVEPQPCYLNRTTAA